MLSNSQAKLLIALQSKKYRQKYRKFIVEGEKMVLELLGQQGLPVEAIFGLDTWAQANAAALKPFYTRFHPISPSELKKVSALSAPNQVLALLPLPEMPLPSSEMLYNNFCFYLDGIRDPGNLGTIIRIADWFGLPAVFCSHDCVDAYNPKTIQATMGAFLRIPVRETPLDVLIAQAPGLPLIGAVMEGENLFKTNLPRAGLIVIGNEGEGIRPEMNALLTHRINIPADPKGGAESLNASVAAGIMAAVLKNR